MFVLPVSHMYKNVLIYEFGKFSRYFQVERTELNETFVDNEKFIVCQISSWLV